jgi:hypothetical protein
MILSWAVLACALAGGQPAGQGGPKDELAALRAAVDQLRAEIALLQERTNWLELERRREVVRQIRAELDAIRAEQARLAELDEARRQDLHDIEALLAAGDVAPGERSGLEISRAELAAVRWPEIDQQSGAARLRESELLRRLETEERLLNSLEEARKNQRGKTP